MKISRPSRNSFDRDLINASLMSISPLHVACASHDITINELRAMLHANPASVSMVDALGRTPLHVFAANEELALTSTLQDAQLLIEEMIVSDPTCVTTQCLLEGKIPFVDVIISWIEAIHSPDLRYSRVLSPGRISQCTFDGLHRSDRSGIESHREGTEKHDRMFRFPTNVSTTPFFRWSLEMLSFIITKLYILSKENGRGPIPRRYTKCREIIIENVASIPLLCKSILLIHENDESHRAFKMPIILNALLNKNSIGMWLVAMFRGDRFTKLRAITFLEHISNVKITDMNGVYRHCSQNEYDAFLEKRMEAYQAVANLEGIMAAMVLLSPKKIEKAASTSIIHYVLDERIGRPSSLCFMLFDLTIYIFLMISYRSTSYVVIF
eukprot:879876-Ditylum_brightwellii.AAC.1